MSKVFNEDLVASVAREMKVADLQNATIGDILLVASRLEELTGIPFIRMDQGSPGLPANRIGIEAEKAALDKGLGAQYPAAAGVPELKEAASRFVKAFIDIDISPRACLPTTGSGNSPTVHSVRLLHAPSAFREKTKSYSLILVSRSRSHSYVSWAFAGNCLIFMIFADRHCVIRWKNILKTVILLPLSILIPITRHGFAWKNDAVVMEDQAYFCMDFRHPFGRPYQAPFVPTVARYTDNYILMLSASKIFSYAGQRIALACVSDKLFDKQYPALAERYEDSGVFGPTFIASIMYMITSGCTATTQYGMAEMLNRSVDGTINFVEDTREYERRAARMKKIFTDNGFTIVYDHDVTQPVGDGFFFTLGYPGMTGGELLCELMYYGVSSISLSTTGSEQQGVRACTSRMREELYPTLEERMKAFHEDHL